MSAKTDDRTRKDGFEARDAGREGARPYRRKPSSHGARRIVSHTQEKAAHPISSTCKISPRRIRIPETLSVSQGLGYLLSVLFG
jgi:hypothetical protein